MADLTKFSLLSKYPSFHILNTYTGSVTIPATAFNGNNWRTYSFSIPLNDEPSLLQTMFNGPNSGPEGTLYRPSSAWWAGNMSGAVQGASTAGGSRNILWMMDYSVSGKTLNILAQALMFYDGTVTPSGPIQVKYKIVDYVAL